MFFLGQQSRGFGKCIPYEYDFEGKQTPFGNIYIHDVDAPKSKPAEMRLVPADKAVEFFAKYYPKFSAKEMTDFLEDFCTPYESQFGKRFYDFEDLKRFNEITVDEYPEPCVLLTGDPRIDEFFFYVADILDIEIIVEE